MSSETFVTLVTNDDYALGALVLTQSIHQIGIQWNLVVFVSNRLSDSNRFQLEFLLRLIWKFFFFSSFSKALQRSFHQVIGVDQLNSDDHKHLQLLSCPEWKITLMKIKCWLLSRYSKCVFLDSDCVVLCPIDDLFEREEFSAALDARWFDCFNSIVFVYRPSTKTFNKLILFAS